MEVALVKAFGWSLVDIDNTAVESLLPFIRRLTTDPATMRGTSPPDHGQGEVKPVYIDQVMHWFG